MNSLQHDRPSHAELAQRLGVSVEAISLTTSAELIDLHIDTFIPVRLWGYDPFQRHSNRGPLGGRLFGHLDLPRAVDGGLTGAVWSITTNPFRTPASRWRVFLRNLDRLRALLQSHPDIAVVRSHAGFVSARAQGKLVAMLAVQGGNALEASALGIDQVAPDLIRVTLVHLTNSVYGATSSPASALRRHRGLSSDGKNLVQTLNKHRVLVDLAHIHPAGFWDAVAVHDKTQPLVVTHTGVCGVKQHWRNLDDSQIRAVADTGGTIGIIFEPSFLRTSSMPNSRAAVVDHMHHVLSVVGDDHVSIGTDFDGNIVPPPELRSAAGYPHLVQEMLDRRWPETRIRKVLGLNFLRVLRHVRPNDPIVSG